MRLSWISLTFVKIRKTQGIYLEYDYLMESSAITLWKSAHWKYKFSVMCNIFFEHFDIVYVGPVNFEYTTTLDNIKRQRGTIFDTRNLRCIYFNLRDGDERVTENPLWF